jgi:hypothetical protein
MTVVRTTSQSFFAAAFEAAAAQFRASRTRRAQRLALVALMDMDAAQLDDLGLNSQDVIEALSGPPPAGPRLSEKRAHRAEAWTPAQAVA